VFGSNPKNPVLGFHGWDETAPQGSVYRGEGGEGGEGGGDQRLFEKKKFFLKTKNINPTLLK
jgi:hypothetical protein